jgi:hypothetical protein
MILNMYETVMMTCIVHCTYSAVLYIYEYLYGRTNDNTIQYNTTVQEYKRNKLRKKEKNADLLPNNIRIMMDYTYGTII